MKHLKGFVVYLFVVLFSVFTLTGCSLKNKTLDSQAEELINALNADDEESFTSLLYPSQEVDTHSFYTQFIDYWEIVNYEDVKLISINVSNRNHSGQSIKGYEGIYQLPRNDEYSNLKIIYTVTDEGSGITDIYLGTFNAQTQTASTVNLVSMIICFVVILVTIVDVIRQRPPMFGVYIVIALLFFSIRINGISLSIPIGAISYWCARKRVLEDKEARTSQRSN